MSHNGPNGNCPRCQQTDQIVKISALYSNGTAQVNHVVSVIGVGAGSGVWAGNIAFNGTQQTRLAELLAPPVQPRPPIRWGCWSISFVIISALALCLNLLTWILIAIRPPADPAIGQGAVSLLAITLLCVLVTIVLIVRRSPTRRRVDEGKVRQWEHAMAIWERLYYCKRDDLVFDPGAPGSRSVPPSEMRSIVLQAGSTP